MRFALIGIVCLAWCSDAAFAQPPAPVVPGLPVGHGAYTQLPAATGAAAIVPPTSIPAAEPTAGPLEPHEVVYVPPADDWWYRPTYWYGPIWEGSLELGVNGAEGNNQAFSLQTGGEFKRKCKTHELLVDIVYAKNTANSRTTQHNAISKARFDRFFDSSPWSLYVLGNGIYDELKPFDFLVSATGGLGYSFIKNGCTTLTVRAGSGFSHEIGGPDDDVVPEANFGVDFEHRISKHQKFYGTIDYYPEWGNFRDYRIISDVGWEFLLDAATNLSLKISIIDRYDSTPNGAKHNDINYSILLLWKL